MIVVAALRKLRPGASGSAVHDYLAHLERFAGLDGIFDFEKIPQRGLDVSDAVVTRWDGEAERWVVMSKPGGAPSAP
jgi:branched-chain amino acid transport system substrate-binding protein